MSNYFSLLIVTIKNYFNLNKLKKLSKLKILGITFLVIYVLGSVIFSLIFYYNAAIDLFLEQGIETLFLPLIYIFTITSTLIFSIYSSKNLLFTSKDNDFLFSMPIKSKVILLTRISMIFLIEIIGTLMMFFSAVIIYGIRFNQGINYYVSLGVLTLFVPLIPTVISALFGYVIGYFTSKSKHKNIFETVFSFFLLGLMMYLMSNIGTILEAFISSKEIIMDILNYAFHPVVLLEKIIINGSYLHLFEFILINVVALVLFVCLIDLNYKKIIFSLSKEKKPTSNKELSYSKTSISKTLLKIEFKRYLASSVYVLNTFFGVLILLIGAIMTFFYSSSEILKMLEISGGSFKIFHLVCALVLFVSMMSNTACASISMEGKSFWILKSIPLDERKILMNKLMLNFLVVIPIMTMSILAIGLNFSLSSLEVLIAVVIGILGELLVSMFGLLMNLKFPRFDFTTDAQVVKQSLSVMLSTMIPMFSIMIIGSIVIASNVNLDLVFNIAIGIMLILILIEYKILNSWGIKRYRSLS